MLKWRCHRLLCRQRRPARSILIYQGEHRSVLSIGRTVLCFVRSWRAYAGDRTACRNEDMDRCRRDGHAARLSRSERTGADGAPAATILRPCICFSRETRRHDQVALVRRRWPLPVREEIGARTFHLAASERRYGIAVAGAALDVDGRHRLAQARGNLDAAGCSISYTHDSPVSMRLLWILCRLCYDILQL